MGSPRLDRISAAGADGSGLQFSRPRLRGAAPLRGILFANLLLAIALLMPGCGGCTSEKGLDREAAAKARAKAEAERRQLEKLPYEIGLLRVQPNDLDLDRIELPPVKPGHWTSVTMPALANHADFSGQLATEPLALPNVPFQLSSVRPIVLSKGQRKTIETLFFVPDGYAQQQFTTRLQTHRGAELSRDAHRLIPMPTQQFFFVVLAREPDRYRFLRALDFVKAPSGRFDSETTDAHYHIALPRVKSRTPLSDNPLAWTAIACLLWDDQDPATLTLAQQAALVDWLHWGGQLLISGPDSLSGLAGSFLEPYLPAAGGDKLELTAELLAPLAGQNHRVQTPLTTIKPWSGERLDVHPTAEVVIQSPSGVPLLVERRVGRGRIVATAFRLGQRELIAWDGFDAFINRYLLRRLPREFSAAEEDVVVNWSNNHDRYDSRLVSRVRFFSRDADSADHLAQPPAELRPPRSEDAVAAAVAPLPGGSFNANQQFEFDGLTAVPVRHSVAGWNDDSQVAQLARLAARDATRIEIPQRSFVVRMLALYLLVLVPLNWGVFRAIGRVEWAWVAAPLIALVGAVVVVRAAQLDIGFVRANNELATLELFADHPRGHLTRFTTLYTSLTTNYDLRYSDPTALAQPFSLGVEQLRGQGNTDLILDRQTDIALGGLPVLSNSVGIVHGEQMFDLEGSLTLAPHPDRPGEWLLTNGTNLALRGAGVAQPEGAAWIGELAAGESRALDFSLAVGGPEWERHRDETPETAITSTEGIPHLRPLVDFADAQRATGEWRLVAWTNQELAGLTIEPRAAQSRQATVVVAHLRPGELPLPAADRSSRAELEAGLKNLRILRGDLEPNPSEAPPPVPTAPPSPPSPPPAQP